MTDEEMKNMNSENKTVKEEKSKASSAKDSEGEMKCAAGKCGSAE